ncbi:hypothetical protein [Nostoc sp. UCD121]|nr:hypothetical protein [Nostoc sp. UCD121]
MSNRAARGVERSMTTGDRLFPNTQCKTALGDFAKATVSSDRLGN